MFNCVHAVHSWFNAYLLYHVLASFFVLFVVYVRVSFYFVDIFEKFGTCSYEPTGYLRFDTNEVSVVIPAFDTNQVCILFFLDK